MNKICRICSVKISDEGPLISNGQKQPLSLFYCRNCDAYFTFPDERNYNVSDFNLIEYYVSNQSYIKNRYKKIFDFVETKFKLLPNRFLDIGSGLGLSLLTAQSHGWVAYGIEPNIDLYKYSKDNLKINVLNGYFSSSLKHEIKINFGDKYNFILIDNVLEHIANPVSFLQDAFDLLDDNGILVCAVPPMDWFRVLLTKIGAIKHGSRSAQLNLFYDPEQHINYFSRKAIRKLIETKLGNILLSNRFHHSLLLNNIVSRVLGFETGYFFIRKHN